MIIHTKKQFEAEQRARQSVPQIRKYSKLKIIRTLGADWETYRSQLEHAGMLDQFFAAEYLAEDDPVFTAFMASVPEEVKTKLSECLWE